MRLTAHRGFAAEHPENTLAAVRAAAEIADEIEIDVRRCGSGELIAFHDERLDRLTDAAGPIAERSIDELRELSVLGSGERIPTLGAVVDAAPPDVTLNVELKEAEIAADAAAVAADAAAEIVFSSFLPDAIDGVPERYETALIVDEEPTASVERASELGCDRIHPHWWLALRSGVVGTAADAGLDVHTWTIERRVTARVLDFRGVDGVIADAPVR